MALSTVTIADTQEWAKRLSWNRNSGIGNALQPALSSANMVMQTVLGPPFSWWWNSQSLSFTCATGPATSTITNVVIASKVATLTTVNTWTANQQLLVSGVTTATQLNGQLLTVLTASGTQITAAVNLPDYATAGDTGMLTALTTQDYPINIPNFCTLFTLRQSTFQSRRASCGNWKLNRVFLSIRIRRVRCSFHRITKTPQGTSLFE